MMSIQIIFLFKNKGLQKFPKLCLKNKCHNTQIYPKTLTSILKNITRIIKYLITNHFNKIIENILNINKSIIIIN